MSQTWIIKDTAPDISTLHLAPENGDDEYIIYSASFESNGEVFSSLKFRYKRFSTAHTLRLYYNDTLVTKVLSYNKEGSYTGLPLVFKNEAYRTLKFDTAPTGDLLTWLQKNAYKQTEYLTLKSELTSVANAIRAKGGTSAQLVYPAGFVSAIQAIQTGVPLQIVVTTSAGATVTATKGSKTVSGTADASGNCTLTVNETGTWTVTAVKGVIVNTVDVVVGTNGVTLALINPVFSDNSWEQIIEICQKKTVPDAWKVGDSKIMTIGGVDYQIDIIGKDHDGYSDLSGRAPLTFQFHNCTRSTQMYTSSYQSGWRSSKIRVEDVPAFLGSMPDVVKNAIRSVTKPVDGSSTDDTLFILSEREVFGVTSKCYGDTSKQYEYYTTPANRKKYYSGSTTSDSWWLRSTANTPSYSMGTVTSTGAVGAASCLGFVGVTYAFCF